MREKSVLLASDLVDSTRMAEQLGDDRMAAVWASHDRIARDLVRRWRGREIKKSDGFLLQFDSAADAAAFALAYHAEIGALEIPLRARVGLHVGYVSRRENRSDDIAIGANPVELEGLAVPVVFRTMALAAGGQTLLTDDARGALQGTKLRVHSHGYWRMKGLDEPVQLFEIGDERSPFVPPADTAKVYRVVQKSDSWAPLATIPNSLSVERDSFVGRKETLRELSRQFDAGARLVTVTGVGGAGKTRLGQHFGWTWMGDFPGGVWFCDLSQARTLDGVVHAVAQGLNLSLGRAEPVAQIGDAVAGRGECLVILDNFEQVAAFAETTIGKWMNRTREARFLVTSRELLGIVGEHRFELDPLSPAEGVELFTERALAAKCDFVCTPDEAPTMDRLVRLLDGLPLAIELAAARIRILPPALLLDRMSKRFDILTTTRGRSHRQATLRSTFDWSWDLLQVHERLALGQLSVFEGSFSLRSAEAVVDLSATSAAPVIIDVIQSLVDKSLVRQVGEGRFGLLRTVIEYASARHRSDMDAPAAAHSSLIESAERRHWRNFSTFDDVYSTGAILVDLDNLIVACRRASASGDAKCAVGALLGAWSVLRFCGPFRTAVELVETVEQALNLSPSERGKTDWVAGSALYQLGHIADAKARYVSGAAFSRLAGDRRTEARLLCAMSDQPIAQGDFETAHSLLTGALAASRELHDRALECNTLNRLGVMNDHRAKLEEARALFEAALSIARELNDRRVEGGLAGNLGSLCHNLGDHERAHSYYERSLMLAQAVGDRRWEGSARCNLGLLHHDLGRHDDARREFESALALSRALGHLRLECTVLCNLGIVTESQNEFAAARTFYEKAVRSAHDLGDRRSEGQFRGYLGLLYARMGDDAAARACLSQGEALLLEVSDALSLGLLLCNRAHAESLAGDSVAADRERERAQDLADGIGAPAESELGRALRKLSLVVPTSAR